MASVEGVHFTKIGTHDAATSASLVLVCTFCLDRQISTRAYAPTKSFIVHSNDARCPELGSIVVNNESSSGDFSNVKTDK